jgi:hypothetical protein
MQIRIKCHNCPNQLTDLAYCAECLAEYFKQGLAPDCFEIDETDGSEDVVVRIESGDRFLAPVQDVPHYISSTDWLS